MLKFSHVVAEDIPQIDAWIKEDSDHNGRCEGSFFANLPRADGSLLKGVVCLKVEDENGAAFYLKVTNAIVVDIQFPPVTTDDDRSKLRKDLKEMFVRLSPSFKNMGFHSVFYESVSSTLVEFFSRFGFRRATNFFKAGL